MPILHTRAVLSIDPLGVPDAGGTTDSETIVKVIRSPWNVADQGKAHRIRIDTNARAPWNLPDAARVRGRALRDAISLHPGVKQMLDKLPDQRDVTPVYIMVSEGEIELIGWETLCDNADAFFSLDEDQRFPIGRIVEPNHDEARAPASMRPPVRLMAVISALGADGRPQWDHLFATATAARAAGLPVELRLLVGDPALRAAIDPVAGDPATAGWLSVSHVDAKGSEIVQAISQWKPQILHFFCHGFVDETDQGLELATTTDYLTDAGKGSAVVRTSQLAKLAEVLPNPWLVTLNCCDTGKAKSALNSMAHRLVRAGFPAAVAMLEPVVPADAHVFTRAFYGRMFRLLEDVAATLQHAEEAPFEWLRPMSAVREALVEEHENDQPPSAREWTLPVLYVRGVSPFCFRRPIDNVTPGQAEEYKKKAAIVAQWLVGPGASEPEEVRRGAIAFAMAGIPRPFWPEVDGTWSADVVRAAEAPAPPPPAGPAAAVVAGGGE